MLPNCRQPIYVVFAALLALAASVVRAQTDEAGSLPVPARLSVAEGAVSFWRPGDEGWSPAQLNMAVEAGDAIYAGNGATVEIQVGPRTYLRLRADTEVTFVRQDAGLLQVSVMAGDASLDARGQPRDQLTEIDTPNAAFTINSDGYYRVGVDDDTTRFVVRHDGHATLQLRDGYDRTITAGEQIIVRGTDELTAEVAAAPPVDSWDRWNDARSDYYDQAASNRHLPADVYGAADLDQYGTWSSAPEYGAVWYPTVAGGWAPYTVGTWYWDPIYEWTWIDAAPWGWAPSHYGRWVHIGGRWAWAPGPRVARPVYLPAVVGFVGFGSGPTVGWVALGWGEPVIPWWGHREMRGRPYWGGWGGPRIVNGRPVEHRADVDVAAIRFHNSQVSHAMVAVPRNDFGHGRDHHFAPPAAAAGRPAPIGNALPMRQERMSPGGRPPEAPGIGGRPHAGPTVREGTPPRGSVTVVPSVRVPPASRHESPSAPGPELRTPVPESRRTIPESRPAMPESRPAMPESRPAMPESRPVAPEPVPHTTMGRPPRPEEQSPRPADRPPMERRIDRPAPAPQRVEVAPAMPRHEIRMPQHESAMPRAPAPAPAPETHAAPAPQRAEPPRAREEPRHHDSGGGRPERRDDTGPSH